MRRPILIACAASVLTLRSALSVAEVSWSLGTTVSHSDNARREDVNEISDTLVSLTGGLNYEHESRRVQASLEAIGNYIEYVDDTYDSDFLTHADASLVFGIAPERFLWTFEDRLGEITINEFGPAHPDNRQSINVFSTGPDLILRLGSQTSVQISGRFADSQFEETEFADDRRLTGSISIIRQTSAKSQWSLSARTTRVEYQLPGDPGYDIQDAYAGISTEGARQTLALKVGASQLKDAGESSTQPFVEIDWNRRLTPSLTLDLSLRSGFSNTTDRFANDTGGIDGSTGAVNVSNILAESVSGDLSLAFKRARTDIVIGVGYANDEYVAIGADDRESLIVYASLNRRMTQRLSGFLSAQQESRDYDTAGGNDDTQLFGAGLDWRAGRNIFLTLGYRGEDRDSDFAASSYQDNVIYLSVSYRRGEAARIGPAY